MFESPSLVPYRELIATRLQQKIWLEDDRFSFASIWPGQCVAGAGGVANEPAKKLPKLRQPFFKFR